jgi:uncharacterized protein
MSQSANPFVWYDLMTTDAPSALAFYRAVTGWDTMAGPPDSGYTVLTAGTVPIGGLMELPHAARDAGARPGWMGYVGVGDVDAVAARVVQAGGVLHRAPEDILDIGRFAVVADPQGAAFTLFNGTGEAPAAAPPWAPGHIGWRELCAADWETAFAFYAALFGWTKGEAIDMGPMGIYQLFATGDAAMGGMMTRQDPSIRPFWLYYINVDDINAAATRVRDAGGQIRNGPHQVPGGSWIVQGVDPQGAVFAMVAPR